MENINDRLADLVISYYAEFPNFHEDILHTQEVACYPRIIASGEGISPIEVALLYVPAWMLDIGCSGSKDTYDSSIAYNHY